MGGVKCGSCDGESDGYRLRRRQDVVVLVDGEGRW